MPRSDNHWRVMPGKASPDTQAFCKELMSAPISSAFSTMMRRKDGVPT